MRLFAVDCQSRCAHRDFGWHFRSLQCRPSSRATGLRRVAGHGVADARRVFHPPSQTDSDTPAITAGWKACETWLASLCAGDTTSSSGTSRAATASESRAAGSAPSSSGSAMAPTLVQREQRGDAVSAGAAAGGSLAPVTRGQSGNLAPVGASRRKQRGRRGFKYKLEASLGQSVGDRVGQMRPAGDASVTVDCAWSSLQSPATGPGAAMTDALSHLLRAVSLEPVVEHGDDARAAPITGSSKRQRVDEQVGVPVPDPDVVSLATAIRAAVETQQPTDGRRLSQIHYSTIEHRSSCALSSVTYPSPHNGERLSVCGGRKRVIWAHRVCGLDLQLPEPSPASESGPPCPAGIDLRDVLVTNHAGLGGSLCTPLPPHDQVPLHAICRRCSTKYSSADAQRCLQSLHAGPGVSFRCVAAWL